jgi:hypothetical protein
MVERSEQEQLATLVGVEDIEPVDTGDILAQGLKAQLGNPNPSQIASISQDIESYGDVAVSPVKEVGQSNQTTSQLKVSSEKLLLALYDIRDNLIDAFGGCKLNSTLSDTLTNQINRIGSCIVNLGGKTEIFDPLNYISGLDIPDSVKNAEEIIERTVQCYKLGSIEDAKIKDNGKEIGITFAGQEGNTIYKASGRIIAKSWTGNEAIDYVYTPGSGKMSVKAFEGGKWVNKSDTDNYNISWELSENDLSQDSAESSLIKEEVSQNTQNKNKEIQDVNGEADIGSPIL